MAARQQGFQGSELRLQPLAVLFWLMHIGVFNRLISLGFLAWLGYSANKGKNEEISIYVYKVRIMKPRIVTQGKS